MESFASGLAASPPPTEIGLSKIGIIGLMADVTQILSQIEQGDPSAAEHLLPIVYEELRKLAAAKMANEKPGQTLQATALVHEAYVRLVGGEQQSWEHRGHFFAAAAEAMRRILVDQARHKKSLKAGGDRCAAVAGSQSAAIGTPCVIGDLSVQALATCPVIALAFRQICHGSKAEDRTPVS